MIHVGVDFGSKKAGTTALSFVSDNEWHIFQSGKNEDADRFLESLIKQIKPGRIFIDAPLSLPYVYSKGSQDPEADYHYRACDREAGAMSPLFLGGLTARAIRLRALWEHHGIEVLETYPKLAARELELTSYKKDLDEFIVDFSETAPVPPTSCSNWHQADSCLAWMSGFRFSQGSARSLGNQNEGIIVF